MKKTVILLVAIFMVSLGFAQDQVIISYTKEKSVLLNDQKIDHTTNLETIKSILGEPVVYKKYPTGKVNYHYPDLGLSIHFVNDNLLFVGANYNWDGDKTFPESTFTGKLEIGEVQFDKNTGEDILSEIKVVEIKCVMPGLCATNPKTEKNTLIIVGFEEEKVTQVGFEFH